MGNKKRASDVRENIEEQMSSPSGAGGGASRMSSKKLKTDLQAEGHSVSLSSYPESINQMEKRKRRKAFDKERHQCISHLKEPEEFEARVDTSNIDASHSSFLQKFPQLHLDHFSHLSSVDVSVRESATEALVRELKKIHKLQEKLVRSGKVETDEDDELRGCHPDLKYALKRLIRGTSSSRGYSRQGFAAALTAVLATIPCAKVEALVKLVFQNIELSSSMKGQEKRECLLGQLFAYGAISQSGWIEKEWVADNNSTCIKEFTEAILSLASRKRYLREPAAQIMLDLIEKLPGEAVSNQVLNVSILLEWFVNATEVGNPEALLLALKIREKICADNAKLGRLLPQPFTANNFFKSDHLSSLIPCFKESTFCQPRVHLLWPVVINILLPDAHCKKEGRIGSGSAKKHKRSRGSNSIEDMPKNLHCFFEVVIEGCFLSSSHDQKWLAFELLLLLLPRLPASLVSVIFSLKLVNCLMDLLSSKSSWLHKSAERFLNMVSNSIQEDDDRRVVVVLALQKHSGARFDCMTGTHTVKKMVAGFKNSSGCVLFVQNLMSMFVDVDHMSDEPSDQSQTTDENSERSSPECKDATALTGNVDLFRNWVVDTLPSVLRSLGPDVDAKFRAQKEIVKFLAIQGLFSASLGTEITSLELKEKLKWPKAAISKTLQRKCIEKLQLLLADAQRREGVCSLMDGPEAKDLGSYFMHFLSTVCNIPSVALSRQLSSEDEEAFKKLQELESMLFKMEMDGHLSNKEIKLHAVRYLLIQLLLHLFLCPSEVAEAAIELVICSRKALSISTNHDSSDEEDSVEGAAKLMDVMVDALLSLLPQSSAPLRSAIEQVFGCFCHEITESGLLRMLRVIKRDLHPSGENNGESSDDDGDLLEIEEAKASEEEDDAEIDTGDNDAHVDEVVQVVKEHRANNCASGDESDGEMDDDAMFRMDSYLADVFKERKSLGGNESVHSQLAIFKLRIVSLLEIYLQKNPGNPHVMTVFSYLAQTFVNSFISEGNAQLRERIGGILQRSLFKAKYYPKSDEIRLSSLVSLLQRSVKSASRTRHKLVALFAQNSTFWLLKLIHAKSLPEEKMHKVVDIFRLVLADYFNNKSSRLKVGFVREVFRRHPWLGQHLFGSLIQNCQAARIEFRKVEGLNLLDRILRSYAGNWDNDCNIESLKRYVHLLGDLINNLLNKFQEKQPRKMEVRRFCCRLWQTLKLLHLRDEFVDVLNSEVVGVFNSWLGNVFSK